MRCCFSLWAFGFLFLGTVAEAQVPQSVTLKKRPLRMGQSWSVEEVNYFEFKNNIHRNGRVVQLVEAKTKDTLEYKATAHVVENGRVDRLWVDFGEVSHDKTINEQPDNKPDPLSKKSYTVQRFGKNYYFTNRVHDPVNEAEVQSLSQVAAFELEDRHPFLPPLKKSSFKLGQKIPLKSRDIQRILGRIYQLKSGAMTVAGVKRRGAARCLVYQLNFVARATFENGVVIEITGSGELYTEIETAQHLFFRWDGAVKVLGGLTDEFGDKIEYKGKGKAGRKTVIRYLSPKKLAPVKLGRVVPEVGQSWDHELKAKSTMARYGQGMSALQAKEAGSTGDNRSYRMLVLGRSGDRVTKARVKFRQFEKVRNSELPDPLLKGLTKDSYVVEKTPKKGLRVKDSKGVELRGRIGEEIREAVKSAFRNSGSDFLALLPQREIQPFKPVRADLKAALARVREDFEDATAVLIDFLLVDKQVIDGRDCAVFLVATRVVGDSDPKRGFSIVGSGTMIVEVKTGWPVSFRESAFARFRRTSVNEKGQLIEERMFGPMSSRQSLRWGPRVKKKP